MQAEGLAAHIGEGPVNAILPLAGELTVVDLSYGIAGAYCGKMLVDGGAEVINVEAPDGDPLRSRSVDCGGTTGSAAGGLLFEYLALSKSSVVVDPTDEDDLQLLERLLAGADAVLWGIGSPLTALDRFAPSQIRQIAPRAIVLAITPYGLVGEPSPPANQFTLQALSGGACGRGAADLPPLAVGGDYGDWVSGVFAATSLLTAHQRARITGSGELVDLSELDAMHLTQTMFAPTYFAASGVPYRSSRVRTIPLIHPTLDGYVGFQVTTGQQWLDFCAMTGRDEWGDDPTLTRFAARIDRFEEINTAIDAWTRQRTTDEIVELAVLFRIPVAPVGNGATIPQLEQCVARSWFVPDPTGRYVHPVPPYTFIGGAGRRTAVPAAALGADTARLRSHPAERKAVDDTGVLMPLPFDGLRIADFTAFWAGPIISHHFAMFGADVIHVESTVRPDGIRAATLRFDMGEGWWEASPTFAGTNTNKRDLTLDMSTERGKELARRLVAECDVLIENYSTRVMSHWGMDYDDLRRINPRLIMVRAPGFWNSGPWADRGAYATTIEQASGAAWVTGFPDDRPDCAGGSLDPVAGTHAVFATLLALEHRRRTGEGVLVEVPQFTSGINVAAEQTIEHSAHGRLLNRVGNRSWSVAPQGSYRVADVQRAVAGVPPDEWVAISVEDDAQWLALCAVIGDERLSDDAALRTVAGRWRAHDHVDAAITAWTRPRTAEAVVGELLAAGIPAARWVQNFELAGEPEVQRRGLYEIVENPILGTVPIIGHPAQFEAGPTQVHRRRAPLLGEHNHAILGDLLGLSVEEIAELERDQIIGNRAKTATAW
jgi:crotonobetainyl-CoA:carnitine CoA-transferase CaiB-like acyl-CoA transferase